MKEIWTTVEQLSAIVDAPNPRKKAEDIGLLPARRVMKAGDIVRQGDTRRGIVAGEVVSRIVDDYYHFGRFVIITEPMGLSCSFGCEGRAADLGWAVEVPR